MDTGKYHTAAAGAGVAGLYTGAEMAMQAKSDPRLHVINNRILDAAQNVRGYTQGFNAKADSIVGTVPTPADNASKGPAPVPNGALDQIDMALMSLENALRDLGEAERRFVGLA